MMYKTKDTGECLAEYDIPPQGPDRVRSDKCPGEL